MDKKAVINVIGIQCKPELDAKFNQWYNEIHIPMLLKFKGIKEITRYRLLNENDDYPKYLTTCKFESQNAYENYEKSPELKAAKEEKTETWNKEGYENKWRIQYEEMKTWVR